MLRRRLISAGIAAAGLLYVAAVHTIAGIQYAKDTQKDRKGVKVRRYTSEYRKQMEDICLATASEKARTDEMHGEFTKRMYCDLYLDHGIAYMLVNEKAKAVGYCLAAKDIGTFLRESKKDRQGITGLSEEYAARAEAEWDGYLYCAEDYPAHLHIDILEEYTGGGNGTLLMRTMLDHLRREGVKGVMLGVAKDNERACRFYQKMGFEQICEFDGGYIFAMHLQEEE